MARHRGTQAGPRPGGRGGRIAVGNFAVLLAASSTATVVSAATCRGQIPIGGGEGLSAFVKGGGISVSGNGLYVDHDSGISLTTSCSEGPKDAWDPESFAQFHLLGKSLSYYVDLSAVHCSCNLAFYLISAPARDPDGVPTFGECAWSPYYCDANRVCGQWCPELDIMEANNAVFAATPHSCDPSSTPHFNNCDRGGKGQNTKYMQNSYGPGPGHTIDTSKPFEVHTHFEGSASTATKGPTLTKMETVLQQGHTKLVLSNTAPPDYLQQVANALDKGMALRITYWGDSAATMSWLDEPPCNSYQTCDSNSAGLATLYDFSLTPGVAPVRPQEPTRGGSLPVRRDFWLGPFLGCVALFFTGVVLTKICQSGYLKRIMPASPYERVTSSKPGPQSSMFADGGGGSGFSGYIGTSAGSGRGLDESESSPASPGPLAARFSRMRSGCLALDFNVDRAYARGAWQQICDNTYMMLRPPLKAGDQVTVVHDCKVGHKRLQEGTHGRVKEASYEGGMARVTVRLEGAHGEGGFGGRSWFGRGTSGGGAPQMEVDFEHEQVYYIETQFQTKLRTFMPLAMFLLFCAAAIAVVFLIARALTAPPPAQAAPPAAPAAPAIPPGGCCSWKDGSCGKTSDYCMVQDNCVQSCKGTWIMPK
mmetsp:Transcript_19652/g.56298  ORF Transcript_19652/g.56298 Transcript_19652/m.56298 type:complete len:648 (+) Transcript_19652:71-2014(+)